MSDLEKSLAGIQDAVRRIAESMEVQFIRCGANHHTVPCALAPGHKGYHCANDGSVQWLDEE